MLLVVIREHRLRDAGIDGDFALAGGILHQGIGIYVKMIRDASRTSLGSFFPKRTMKFSLSWMREMRVEIKKPLSADHAIGPRELFSGMAEVL
jgi:hypothetical protein